MFPVQDYRIFLSLTNMDALTQSLSVRYLFENRGRGDAMGERRNQDPLQCVQVDRWVLVAERSLLQRSVPAWGPQRTRERTKREGPLDADPRMDPAEWLPSPGSQVFPDKGSVRPALTGYQMLARGEGP